MSKDSESTPVLEPATNENVSPRASAVAAQMDTVPFDLDATYNRLSELSFLLYEAIEEIGNIQCSEYGKHIAQPIAVDVLVTQLNAANVQIETEFTLLISTMTRFRIACETDDAVCTQVNPVIAQTGSACDRLSAALGRITVVCSELSAAIVRVGAVRTRYNATCTRLCKSVFRIGTASTRRSAVLTRIAAACSQFYAAVVQFGAACAPEKEPYTRLSAAITRIDEAYSRLSGAIAQLDA